MSELFEEEEIISEDSFNQVDQLMPAKESGATILDARKRLEKMLEEKRLREELEEFEDF